MARSLLPDRERRLWANAGRDAAAIMGRRRVAPRSPVTSNADEDPLAWWCLTELLVAYGKGEKS